MSEPGTEGGSPPSSPGIFSAILAWGKKEVAVIGDDLKQAWDAVEPQAVTDIESFVGQFFGHALTAVQNVNASDLLDSEKRKAATTQLTDSVVSAGYSLEQQGISSGINFMIELAVNFFKLLQGNAVAAPKP